MNNDGGMLSGVKGVLGEGLRDGVEGARMVGSRIGARWTLDYIPVICLVNSWVMIFF